MLLQNVAVGSDIKLIYTEGCKFKPSNQYFRRFIHHNTASICFAASTAQQKGCDNILGPGLRHQHKIRPRSQTFCENKLISTAVNDRTKEIKHKLTTFASFASRGIGTRDLVEANVNRQTNEVVLCHLLHFFDSSFTDGVFVLLRGLRRSAFTGNDARRFEDIIRGSLQKDRA